MQFDGGFVELVGIHAEYLSDLPRFELLLGRACEGGKQCHLVGSEWFRLTIGMDQAAPQPVQASAIGALGRLEPPRQRTDGLLKLIERCRFGEIDVSALGIASGAVFTLHTGREHDDAEVVLGLA